MQPKTFSDKTSAATKSIGFEYQYYYFLYTVLGLKKTETAGLEVLDDVHSDLSTNRQIFVQLKHSTIVDSEGNVKNLTQYDPSLWKTLSNWTSIIKDPALDRADPKKQIEFISKTDFLLVTNKIVSPQCDFLHILEQPENAFEKLTLLEKGTSDQKVKDYINDLITLEPNVLIGFIKNIKIEDNADDLIAKCHQRIHEMHIDLDRVEEVFKSIDSTLRSENYIAIKNGEKIIISFEDFHRKYRKYFALGRTSKLVMQTYYSPFPSKINDQLFIRQLLDIGDIQLTDTSDIADYTKYKLLAKDNLNNWIQKGLLTQIELDLFNEHVTTKWKNTFKQKHRFSSSLNCKAESLALLDDLRKEELSLDNQEMNIQFSNGQYYLLSDIPKIGWHKDWEKLYK